MFLLDTVYQRLLLDGWSSQTSVMLAGEVGTIESRSCDSCGTSLYSISSVTTCKAVCDAVAGDGQKVYQNYYNCSIRSV